MARFVMFRRLPPKDTVDTIIGLRKWFDEHPRRRVCNTDLFKVRRGHIEDDVFKYADCPRCKVLNELEK